jgi:hypothetical protein
VVEPVVLQTGPERFRVLLGDGRVVEASLAHHTRRGLGVHGVAPVVVATEIVRFLLERGEFAPAVHDPPDGEVIALGAAAGRYPGFVDELRGRLV